MTQLKRIAAFFFDWLLCLIGIDCLSIIVLVARGTDWELSNLHKYLTSPLIFLFIIIFILRDRIFRGRSPGKRLFGLYICDRDTITPKKTRLVIRNLSTFLIWIDALVFLFSGDSIGDRGARTTVMTQAEIDVALSNPADPAGGSNRKQNTKRTLIVIAVLVACLLLLAIFIKISLHFQKDNAEYLLAYEYLITSETFLATGAELDDIRFNRYSSYTSDNETTVYLGFDIHRVRYTVVCHKYSEEWQVCTDCTSFD